MFQGTIPQAVRQMLADAAQDWTATSLSVACSGNLTIERVFAGRLALRGCDVSIYSCALGSFFAGQPFRLELKPEHAEAWGWLADGMTTPSGRLATLLLLTNLSLALDSTHRLKDNPYWRRMGAAYRAQWPTLLEKTVARLDAVELKLESFHCGDAVDWLADVPRDSAVASFPPFFAGGYETMWRHLDGLFSWDAPAYADLFDDRRTLFLDRLTDRRDWAFGTSTPLLDYANRLRGMTQTTARGVPLYVYSSSARMRVVMPRTLLAPLPVPKLTPGAAVAGPLQLLPLTAQQFDGLRAQYLNPAIKPAAASAAYGVVAGGQLVGAFAFSTSYGVPGASGDAIYLLSDFAVAPTDYARLSKLVLTAALSREAQLLAERLTKRRVRWLVTTAFSQHPVSMKYRGLFDQTGRKPSKTPEFAYQLQYQAAAGRWSLDEGLAQWQKKHGSRSAPSE